MSKVRTGGIRGLLGRLFPERQFYHRSHGEVRFISLSARNQMGLVIVTLCFLLWVAYSSVNVVFKKQIISANEFRLRSMQAEYEVRLTEMQSAYDELNALLVLAQERFEETTKDLETKHSKLESFVMNQSRIEKNMAVLKNRLAKNAVKGAKPKKGNAVLMQAIDLEPTKTISRIDSPSENNNLKNVTQAMRSITTGRVGYHRTTAKVSEEVEDLDGRVDEIAEQRQVQLAVLEERATSTIEEFEAFVSTTGLNVDDILRHHKSALAGVGGPYIPLEGSKAGADVGDLGSFGDQYDRQIFRLDTKLDRLSRLESALSGMPLALPTDANLRKTSGFGPRRDPFTRKSAFHSALDFAGPYKSNIYATAPGKVVFAGRRNAYGRLVEIDHGHGFKTRYAHLYRIKVKVGDTVDLGQVVGLLGSSGRSTGPHLHYEIWFEGRVRDPENFLEAGRYVFKS